MDYIKRNRDPNKISFYGTEDQYIEFLKTKGLYIERSCYYFEKSRKELNLIPEYDLLSYKFGRDHKDETKISKKVIRTSKMNKRIEIKKVTISFPDTTSIVQSSNIVQHVTPLRPRVYY